jgi:hypothetical protein
VVVAVLAVQPRKAVGHIAAGLEALELPEHEARQAATRRLELVEKDGQTLPHDLVEQIAARPSILDSGGHEGRHSKSWANVRRGNTGDFGDGRR